MKLSDQITTALGSDDWLVLHNGHHLFTADELDAKMRQPIEPSDAQVIAPICDCGVRHGRL